MSAFSPPVMSAHAPEGVPDQLLLLLADDASSSAPRKAIIARLRRVLPPSSSRRLTLEEPTRVVPTHRRAVRSPMTMDDSLDGELRSPSTIVSE
jgi:hypothetical protein